MGNYPMTSALTISNEKLKLSLDMNTLNRRAPSLERSKIRHGFTEESWKLYVENRRKLRENVQNLFDTFEFDLNICKIPMNSFCKSCEMGKLMMELIDCYGCGQNSHVQCNNINNRSAYFYKGNNIEFICVLNKCNEHLKNVNGNDDIEQKH
eukprot:329182_1